MDKYLKNPFILLLLCGFLLNACTEKIETINIAVASNFESTLNQIVGLYQNKNNSSITINIIAASSGVLATQIINKAPYDLFLSADTIKPNLVKQKLNSQNPVESYAVGQLALWIPDSKRKTHCIDELTKVKSLSMANPKTAPYGKAALDIIQNKNIQVEKIINTSSVSQAYLYTQEKLTQAGFVAYPMLDYHSKGCIQRFTDSQLTQSMILLNEKANDFYNFILSEDIQNLIQESGYIKADKLLAD